MEHSSHKNLSRYSRGLERNTRNANGEPERQTPSSSHQPPTLTRSIYLNMAPIHGTGWKGARAAEKKYYPRPVSWKEGRVEIFFTSRRSEPLRLSIPQARNFVLCLSNLTSHDGSHTLAFSPAYSRC